MHVIVTRPQGDAEPFKSRLEEMGLRVTLSPLIEIVPEKIAPDDLRGATALIVTSRNAVSGALRSVNDLPFFAVGPGTGAAAREIGFTNVVEGPGTGAELAPILESRRAELGAHPVYLRGDVVAFDVEGALASAGIPVRAVNAYRSVAAQTLNPEVIKALQSGSIDAVTLMSPRTGETWARLVADLSPPVQLSRVAHLCLSERVAEALGQPEKSYNVQIASRPNLEEMIALVKRLAANSKAE
ncbi:uroporphyrinogen-III synthase [Hyphomicrobium sp.]|uniref:uroporphyrinogen-III synthase n=1 Tax=Hyphomicrobium sp. TaxID=82 RepID=UPI002D7773CC|nr:uroporphyrinogen-III synthase [Hyphomicrobium sp.]HET6388986.1 uroporphyrinogen-III synthase [Hyphomicrobium sp.]